MWSVNFGDSRKRNWSGEFLRLAAPCDQKQWRERDQPGQKRNRDRHSTESERSLNDFLLSRLSFVQKHEKKDFYILHAVNMVLNIWHNYSLNFQVRQRVGKLEKK